MDHLSHEMLTDEDIVSGLLGLDDEQFALVYEAYRQWGTNHVGGLLSALNAVRNLRGQTDA